MSDGTPTGNGAPDGTQPAAGSSSASAPAASDWLASIADGELKGYAANKGWKEPAALVQSYKHLESTIGVPADQILKLPKGDDAQAWAGVWKKLGAPEKAEDYQLPETHKALAPRLLELGVPVKAARKIVEGLIADGESRKEAEAAEKAAALQREKESLGGKWGAKYAENMARAQQAARRFGVNDEVIGKLQDAGGFSTVMDLFRQIGESLGEDSFVTSDTSPGFGGPTKEMAQAEINRLMNDTDFVNRLATGDAKAQAEWDRFHKIAFSNP